MDGITELAKMMKDRENPSLLSITTGSVLQLPPDPIIKLTNEINFYSRHLIFAEHLLKGYQRNVELIANDVGKTSVNSQHSHDVHLNFTDKTLKFTDGLKIGDEVIIIPTPDLKKCYVVGKAVRFDAT